MSSFAIAQRQLPALTAAALVCLVKGLAVVSPAAAQAPDENWRVVNTEHFRIIYPQELDSVASRIANHAEWAYQGLEAQFDEAPRATIDIVVSDHSDMSNGFATVIPWNRITLLASPPMEGFELAYFDNWLELVVTHELTHIFHLDRRGTAGGVVKAIFGRPPVGWPIFPNRTLPRWTIEGLATYYESLLTDAGRVRGTFHDMVLRTAALEERFETLQQVSGESELWPAGNRPYIYGSMFIAYLAEKYGRDRITSFARAIDGQFLPFRINAAATQAFGVSFTDAFSAWTHTVTNRYMALVDRLANQAPLTRSEPVAATGRFALFPKIAPDGTQAAFARSDGLSDAQIHLTKPDGTDGRNLTRTNGLSLFDWTRDGRVVFSQIEFTGPYRSYKDLYITKPTGGHPQRLTHGARVDFPSVSPDGSQAVAVQQGDGRTWLVLVNLTTGDLTRLVEPTDNVHWAYPAWSPDGQWIAVSRWETGAFYDLLILDTAGRTRARVTRDRAVDLAPSWSPDSHQVFWASDRSGIPNIFAVDIHADGQPGLMRQVTNLATGGSYPAVDPSGTWIYFSAYHADGWHIERIPYDPTTWLAPGPVDDRFAESHGASRTSYPHQLASKPRSYSPFPSLWPRFWTPTFSAGETRRGTRVLGPTFGAQTSVIDTVRRHAATAALRYEPQGGRFTGGAIYTFFGMGNPIINLSARQRRSSAGFLVESREPQNMTPVQRELFLIEREREIGVDVSLTRRRVRSHLTASVGASYVWEHRTLLDAELNPERILAATRPSNSLPQLTARVGYDNTRVHPFSISPENGLSGNTQVRHRWDPGRPTSHTGKPWMDGSWSDVTGTLKLFKALTLPGFAHHVLAFRISGGAARGGGAHGMFYSIGGAAGEAEQISGVALLGESTFQFPVRGYPWGVKTGSNAWSTSVEYRFPLTRLHRGLGATPVYGDWISGTVFLDAGNAWGPETVNTSRGRVASIGTELLFSGLPLWTTSTLLRAGLAFPQAEKRRATAYLRLGLPF